PGARLDAEPPHPRSLPRAGFPRRWPARRECRGSDPRRRTMGGRSLLECSNQWSARPRQARRVHAARRRLGSIIILAAMVMCLLPARLFSDRPPHEVPHRAFLFRVDTARRIDALAVGGHRYDDVAAFVLRRVLLGYGKQADVVARWTTDCVRVY